MTAVVVAIPGLETDDSAPSTTTGWVKLVLGGLLHVRAPYDVHHQVTVRANRDTLYSFGVFDLTEPLTVHLPELGGRYQSLMACVADPHRGRRRGGPGRAN
ncbi:MAG: DUF1254 domain-containing protein [Acidimicrobiales bacterium]